MGIRAWECFQLLRDDRGQNLKDNLSPKLNRLLQPFDLQLCSKNVENNGVLKWIRQENNSITYSLFCFWLIAACL